MKRSHKKEEVKDLTNHYLHIDRKKWKFESYYSFQGHEKKEGHGSPSIKFPDTLSDEPKLSVSSIFTVKREFKEIEYKPEKDEKASTVLVPVECIECTNATSDKQIPVSNLPLFDPKPLIPGDTRSSLVALTSADIAEITEVLKKSPLPGEWKSTSNNFRLITIGKQLYLCPTTPSAKLGQGGYSVAELIFPVMLARNYNVQSLFIGYPQVAKTKIKKAGETLEGDFSSVELDDFAKDAEINSEIRVEDSQGNQCQPPNFCIKALPLDTKAFTTEKNSIYVNFANWSFYSFEEKSNNPEIVSYETIADQLDDPNENQNLIDGMNEKNTEKLNPYIKKIYEILRRKKKPVPDYHVVYTIPYAPGPNLHHVLKQQFNLTIDQRYEIALSVIEALEQYHKKNRVHQDLKEVNMVLVKRSDGSFAIEFIDRELARSLDHTSIASRFYTAGYIGVERYYENYKLSPKRDIFALGAVLSHILGVDFDDYSPQLQLYDQYLSNIERMNYSYKNTNEKNALMKELKNPIATFLYSAMTFYGEEKGEEEQNTPPPLMHRKPVKIGQVIERMTHPDPEARIDNLQEAKNFFIGKIASRANIKTKHFAEMRQDIGEFPPQELMGIQAILQESKSQPPNAQYQKLWNELNRLSLKALTETKAAPEPLETKTSTFIKKWHPKCTAHLYGQQHTVLKGKFAHLESIIHECENPQIKTMLRHMREIEFYINDPAHAWTIPWTFRPIRGTFSPYFRNPQQRVPNGIGTALTAINGALELTLKCYKQSLSEEKGSNEEKTTINLDVCRSDLTKSYQLMKNSLKSRITDVTEDNWHCWFKTKKTCHSYKSMEPILNNNSTKSSSRSPQ